MELSRYPRPNVAVDVAIMTGTPDTGLSVLVMDRLEEPRGACLPGRFLREDETIRDCVRATLVEKCDIEYDADLRLLRVFDKPGRDPRGWTISLAHCLGLPFHLAEQAEGRLVPIDGQGRLPRREKLLFDHAAIVRAAAHDMRERYELAPDPDGLLDRPFTLHELRLLHESVLGARLHRDTFRRRMTPHLVPSMSSTGKQATMSHGGAPARLWARGDVLELSDESRRRLKLPRAE